MKKKLLFVNESLTLGGGEKSLVALLSGLNPDKYEIDLQLFRYGGALDQFVPSYVNILPPIPYIEFVSGSWGRNILSLGSNKNRTFFMARFRYSRALRKGQFTHPEKAQLFWESVKNVLSVSSKKYDVAIGYAHGVPTYYVVEKVRAAAKVAWINASLNFHGANKQFQHGFYSQLNNIVPVSELIYEQLTETFPDLKNNLFIIPDRIDYETICKMAKIKAPSFPSNTFNLLTVARLGKRSKGYDITLESCKILNNRKINFHWYAIGEGGYRAEMEAFIKQNNLENRFTLLGAKANPYPYYLAADLYVQTSRYEGFGLSIAEARLLNTPVVTTRYDTVFEQMIDGNNGLVVDMSPEAVADGIERMMKDKELYRNIVAYLKKEQKVNTESVQRFDELIANLS